MIRHMVSQACDWLMPVVQQRADAAAAVTNAAGQEHMQGPAAAALAYLL
jgi:hypothetical protein